jgi:gliding motility-associated-like protein
MKHTLSLILFLVFLPAFSQQEASVWYFGVNAGIKFNSNGNVTTLTDGQLSTTEGCATIADSNGNLLFYTDGVTVWNRNHAIMFNGSGLMGNTSTSQSATIVPLPGSTTLFYVFTLDYEVHPNGFRYSIVDMSLDSGFGAINSSKNILIYTPSDEKLSVVKHTNNTDYWVVTHGFNSNTFYSYLLTASGLSAVPVLSDSGSIVGGTSDNVWGTMKISPDGSKLAFSHGIEQCQLFDFDVSTGIVSNPITLYLGDQHYGVEFSPSSKVLYLSTSFSSPRKIIQYDLLATNIVASAYYINNPVGTHAGLQLGPNGKIYVAQLDDPKLSVIDKPNIIGAGCNFQPGAIDLAGRLCQFGLPPFITSYFNAGFSADNLCLGSNTQFSVNTSQTILSSSWDFGDTFSSTLPNPTHQYATAGNYDVTATITTAAGTSTKTKQITISAIPNPTNTIGNQNVCGVANMSYNLSLFDATVLSGQSTTTYGVAYFLNTTDVTNHSNILSASFALPLGTTTFYAKVYNKTNVNCYVYTSFVVTLYKQPIANAVSDFIICENLPYNAIEQFDLSTKNSAVLGTQNSAEFTISYHASQYNADHNLSPLPSIYTNTFASEVIYIRIQNNTNTSCFATKTFNIKVVQKPILSVVSDFKLCDDSSNNGIENFNLALKTTEILNLQSPAVFEVKYFYNLTDAQNNTNEILSAINNSINNQSIFFTISAIGNLNCKVISDFKLIVTRLPIANAGNPIFICDDVTNDAKAMFSLQSNTNRILGPQSATDYKVSYHALTTEANSNTNSLPSSYQNTSNPQTIYVRVTNNQNSNCFASTSFQIGLYKMPIAYQPQKMVSCDDIGNDGFEDFNLQLQNTSILGTQLQTDFAISYHLSQSDADSGANPLTNNYTNTNNPQTVYARIVNNLSAACFDTKSFQLIVRSKPQLLMDDVYSICEASSITVSAPIGFTTYLWSNGANTPSTTLTLDGNYSVTVTRDYGDIICDATKIIQVNNSNRAKIIAIDTSEWTDNENTISVQVTGDGIYEFSLDNIHFQDSNQFYGLFSGNYTVYVRDKKGCGTVTSDIFLLMYPKFFTPNEDGNNDYWNIKGLDKNTIISIFDRYGKLLKQFNSNGSGWDGKSNNQPMPTNDYWYTLQLVEGKILKGHFTLKR